MENVDLKICNLVSRGMSLAEARDAVQKKSTVYSDNKVDIQQKLTASDKKKALAEEIEALGGEVPDLTQSVAKFKEALTAAKSKEA